MKLILIRHSIRQDIKGTDCSISDDGIKLIDERANDILQYIEPSSIPHQGVKIALLSSPFKRTIETAMCLATHFKDYLPDIVIEPLLHETLFNNRMTRYIHESVIRYSRGNSEKLLDKNRYETWNDIRLRCIKFLYKIVEGELGTTVVAVTHGGIINMILTIVDPKYKFDIYESDPTKYVPKYFDYVVLKYENSKWNIEYKNF